MGLLHQISDSSTCIRTANSQDIGVRGSIVVNFKIGPCSFTHKFIVCKGITRPFILGKEFLSHHCFKLGWTDDNKRFAEYKDEVIAVASQAVMDDRIMVSHAVQIPARHFAMVPTKCPNMFSGRVEAHPCPEFKSKFPNLYLEPMQYNNPDGKWQEEIPYMIINLEYDKDIYLGKDTVMAYAWEEDKTCEYLEVNEIIELTEFKNWTSTKGKSIIESDLVFSPAQVTEHHHVELKDQEISQETRERFEKLKKNHPKVFSVSNQDIGHTNLVTMHVDTGDNPPICQKPYTLPLKHYSWVQQEIETLEHVGVIKKSISPWASPIVVVPKKSAPGEAPRWRMCVDFRKINELQPKTQRVDKQTDTQGNLSLIPLPKIDEMYANLCGAKIFTTLDLRSGYYHITLDNESKAKTAFVTPFGKYEFNAVPFGLAQAPAYFQQLISIVLQDCSDFAMAYLDDIIIFSQNEEEHLKHIEIIFKKLKKAGLKLKESKCDFFKKEIHYLGHLISVSSIQPLPEKLDSIRNMPKPRSPKEIKQFLGLTGYYRKFVPRFSDMARPLTKLLAHDCKFEWTKQCDISFQMLKDTLCSAPILRYPDTSKPYTLYTDASKYGWAGVLTQSHTSTVDGKEIMMDHPVSYVSGLFHGSQLNWATLTKEAYAIYMSIKKSTFYLTGHEITLRSDHLPLKKFLRKMTLNNTGKQLVH